jgi:hypothetical protein
LTENDELMNWWAKKKRNEELCGKDCAVVSPASVVAEWPQNDWPG